MLVLFPSTAATCSLKGNVTFVAMVDATEVICEVSPEALVDHFGARRTDRSCLLAAFEAHREEILSIAATVLPHRLSGRHCLLFSRDFPTTRVPRVHRIAKGSLHPQPDALARARAPVAPGGPAPPAASAVRRDR